MVFGLATPTLKGGTNEKPNGSDTECPQRC